MLYHVSLSDWTCPGVHSNVMVDDEDCVEGDSARI